MGIISFSLMIASIGAAVLAYCCLILSKRNHEANEKLKILGKEYEELVARSENEIAREKAKTDFFSNMGHEIRTPLNAISCAVDLLSKEQIQSSSAQTYLGMIQSSSESLVEIVNEVIDFSRLSTGKMSISEFPYDICELIKDVRKEVASRLSIRDVSFTIDINPSIPKEMIGDSIRIKQILMNLIDNAIRNTSKGEIRLLVDYERVAKEMIDLSFAVKDTGKGLTPKEKETVFDSFATKAGKKDNQDISAIGLNVCQKLSELMGGNVTVESELGKGSEFTARVRQKVVKNNPVYVHSEIEKYTSVIWEDDIHYVNSLSRIFDQLEMEYNIVNGVSKIEEILGNVRADFLFVSSTHIMAAYSIVERVSPATTVICVSGIDDEALDINRSIIEMKKPFFLCDVQKIIDDVKQHREFGIDSNMKLTAPSARILIVDDNKVNLKVAKALIETFEISTTAVNNGYEAIERIERGETFDLIFMDHMMPGIDGIQTTGRIIEIRPESDKTPIIALTANRGKEIEDQFYECGMSDILPKPIGIKQMTYTLERWLPKEKQIHTEIKVEKEKEEDSGPSMFDPKAGLDAFWNDQELYIRILKNYIVNSEKFIRKVVESDIKAEKLEAIENLLKISGSVGVPNFVKQTQSVLNDIKHVNDVNTNRKLVSLQASYLAMSKEINAYIDSNSSINS